MTSTLNHLKCAALTLIICSSLTLQAGQSVNMEIDLDRTILPADIPNRVVVKVALDAPKIKTTVARTPVNLTIVLDRSGSMSGQKIEDAKSAAIEVLNRLNANDIFSLVIYDSNIQTLVPAQSAANAESIIPTIRAITPQGNTALFGGVSQGAAEIRKHLTGQYFHRIVLLSDGLANVGPSNPDDLERLGRALMKEGISVTTVGLGNGYNEDLMTRLSMASDGNSYYVENSNDLPRIFQKELGDVLSVAAIEITVKITCPEGIRPIRIIGREGRIYDNKAEIRLNQLYGGQQKYVLIEVEVPATAANQKRQIAQASASYKQLEANETSHIRKEIHAGFSADQGAVVSGANKAVQTDVAYNVNSLVLDESVELMDQNKKQEAIDNLRKNAVQLRQTADEYSNEALGEQALILEEQAKQLEAEGMDSKRRKMYRTESLNIRAQQKSRTSSILQKEAETNSK